MNGVAELVDYGLSECEYGFGVDPDDDRACNSYRASSEPEGNLTFAPTGGTAREVVGELDLLLTAGRLDNHSRRVIEDAYANEPDAATGLRTAQKLFAATPEFHATNIHAPTGAPPRTPPAGAPSAGRQYRAVVVVFLAGAADSWNFLVPHSECGDHGDLFENHASIRGEAGVNKSTLLPINASDQPCAVYGLHPELDFVKTLYDRGDAAFLANVGELIEPTTRQQYFDGSVELPTSLFAHNFAQRAAQNVDANTAHADGILGRVFSALEKRDPAFASKTYSVAGSQKVFEGAPANQYRRRRSRLA